MRLIDILSDVQRCEDEELEIPTELGQDLKDKVDDYAKVLAKLEADEIYLDRMHAHYKELKEKKTKTILSLKKYVLDTMKAFNWEELKGKSHRLKLVKQERFCPTREPTAEDAVKFAFSVSEMTVTTRKWDKDLLKKLYETTPEFVGDAAEKKLIEYVKWG